MGWNATMGREWHDGRAPHNGIECQWEWSAMVGREWLNRMECLDVEERHNVWERNTPAQHTNEKGSLLRSLSL